MQVDGGGETGKVSNQFRWLTKRKARHLQQDIYLQCNDYVPMERIYRMKPSSESR